MFPLIGLVVACVGAMLGFVAIVQWIRTKWPSAIPSTIGAVNVDQTVGLIQESALLGFLGPCWALAKTRGDTKMLDLFNQVRAQAATWDDPPPVAPVVTPTVTIIGTLPDGTPASIQVPATGAVTMPGGTA
jgi:hypothetical protein